MKQFNIENHFINVIAVGLIYTLMVADAGTAQRSSARSHLDWARVLVRELQPDQTSYQHKNGYIAWKDENGAAAYESHADCSRFLNELLEHSYGFTPQYFSNWLNARRPLATHYFDAIVHQHGFKQIQRVGDIRPGDILAIRYPPGTNENTGHIMLVADYPRHRKPTKPEIDDAEQWEVSIIDSSESGHGKTDTRHRDDGTFGSGVGEGVFRIYANKGGEIVGYTWSTFANSDYYDQSTRRLVVGRLAL